MSRPVQDPAALASFYHLNGAPVAGHACRGLACFAARADHPQRWAEACAAERPLHCPGQCHVAPAVANGWNRADVRPLARVVGTEPVLLGNVIGGGVRNLDDYLGREGGAALHMARSMQPEALIRQIHESGLRGRGGAGFPAGRKWQSVREAGRPAVIVVNADEGDPGAFSDKALLEDDPFCLLEAIAIAAHAIGADEAIIYIRCEYPQTRRSLEQSLAQASAAGWPGNVSIRVFSGLGSFVCGEETALLNSLEHRRPFVRPRPPLPSQSGLHGQPTLVHNVETLCAVPWIVRNGPQSYRCLGHGDSAGTKLLSLCSLFRQPGLVEVPFGVTLRRIVEEFGGGIRRGELLGVMFGGPLAGLLPQRVFDTPFSYEDLARIGGAVGHGGVIAFADDTTIPELVAEVFRFGANESCGLCVPCHRGTAELQQTFQQDLAGTSPGLLTGRWSELVAALEQTSLCGHGRGLAEFARSIERHFFAELVR
jgi:formate dehydrogenase iron-sulfur subunit